MENPSTLLNEVVAKLKAIPGLANVLVEAYDDEAQLYRNPEEARDNFQYATGILAFYEGGAFPRQGETKGVRHDFSLLLKCQSNISYFDLLPQIYDGVPDDGQCLKFIDHELTGCEPFTDFEHRQLTDRDGNTFWSIRLSAVEK